MLHDSDEELLSAVVPFVTEGLARREPTILGVDARRRELILDAVGTDDGLIVLPPESDVRPSTAIEQRFDRFTDLVLGGAGRIRALGVRPLSAWEGWARYEAAINEVYARFPLWAVCAYDRRITPPDVIADVLRTHPHKTVGDSGRRLNAEYVEPGRFLTGRAPVEADPLLDTPPCFDVADPTSADAQGAVQALCDLAGLDPDSASTLRLAAVELVANADRHGRPPVRICGWMDTARVVVSVRDAGSGPVDPFVGLRPDRRLHRDAAGALTAVHQAVDGITLVRDSHGFAVRVVVLRASSAGLTQRR